MNMNPIIVSYATDYLKASKLLDSCKEFGWPIHLIIEPWTGFRDKFLNVLRASKVLKGSYSHIISLDAYDCVVRRPLSEFPNWTPQLVLAAETNCWPDKRLERHYPRVLSQYKYVNSQFLLDLRYDDLPEFDRIQDKDDQFHLSKYYLTHLDNHQIVLDTECRIFQSLYQVDKDEFIIDHNRIMNIVTGTYPFFFHGNGKSDMSWL